MNSFDDTLVIAAREGNLQKVEYLVHEKGYDINSTSYKNKVNIPAHPYDNKTSRKILTS